MATLCKHCGARIISWGQYPNGLPVIVHNEPWRDKDHEAEPKEEN